MLWNFILICAQGSNSYTCGMKTYRWNLIEDKFFYTKSHFFIDLCHQRQHKSFPWAKFAVNIQSFLCCDALYICSDIQMVFIHGSLWYDKDCAFLILSWAIRHLTVRCKSNPEAKSLANPCSPTSLLHGYCNGRIHTSSLRHAM